MLQHGFVTKAIRVLAYSLIVALISIQMSSAERDRGTDFQIILFDGGDFAAYSGPIVYGADIVVKEFLNAHPNVTHFGFNSYGGRMEVAKKLFYAIKERRISTFVYGECLSACSIAYLGGEPRVLHAGATLGFHKATGFVVSDFADSFGANLDWANEVIGLSEGYVDEEFIKKAFEVDQSEMYTPDAAELVASGYVTSLMPVAFSASVSNTWHYAADPFELTLRALDSQDWALAVNLLEKQVKPSDPIAYFILGKMYADGIGVSKDLDAAAKLYGIAVSHGVPSAMNNLGQMYVRGEGVEMNVQGGIELIERSAALGDLYALRNMAVRYYDGDGVEQNSRRSATLFLACAAKGLFECQFLVGFIYEHGVGRPADPREALVWYLVADQSLTKPQTHAKALAEAIKRVSDQLSEVQIAHSTGRADEIGARRR